MSRLPASSARWFAPLLWLILAALLLGMGYLMLRACAVGLPGGPTLIRLCGAEPAAASPLPDEALRERSLRRRILDLENTLADLGSCPVPEPVEEAAAPPPEPPPEPPSEPLASCPQRRPQEVLVVLDTSLSMGFDYDLGAAAERELDALEERAGRGDFLAELQTQMLMDRLLSSPGRDRIDVAARALTDLVEAAYGDVDFSLMTFSLCDRVTSMGTYAPSRRDELVAAIQGIGLDPNTALAYALDQVPSHVSGGRTEDEPAFVVLVSDGRDSCGGDPCAAATRLRNRLPHTNVNVIAISRELGSLQCIADATGGRFTDASRSDDLGRLMAEAAGQDLPEHCR